MSRNVTKHDLILDIAKESSISQKTVRVAIESFLQHIKHHMGRNETIELRGFGTFTHSLRKSRPARNPRTGQVVRLKERMVPVLRFCDEFRKASTIHAVEAEGE